MRFEIPLHEAVLLRRYKRFLADVRFADDSETTVHCANTGSMTGCAEPGSRIWLSHSSNPKRKYPYTWELVETTCSALAGINTAHSNKLVEEGIINGVALELQGYTNIRREVPYAGGRIDLLLEKAGQRCYVEVKNVTLLDPIHTGTGLFPDAVSKRGTRQLAALSSLARKGERAVVFYCVQHEAIQSVQPACGIDPQYAKSLYQAQKSGVEVLAYAARMTNREIILDKALPVTVGKPVASN